VSQDTEIWREPSRSAADRVDDLLGRMTLEEKVAQLTSVWLGNEPRDSNVAPMQGEFSTSTPPLAEVTADGLGQLTRVFGTRPLRPADGARTLREFQAQIVAASRFGIPAVAHEECLTGCAGGGWRKPSARTLTWSGRSVPGTCAACSRPGSRPR
jgi:beta-xylosidase